jgi:hypothetical protein
VCQWCAMPPKESAPHHVAKQRGCCAAPTSTAPGRHQQARLAPPYSLLPARACGLLACCGKGGSVIPCSIRLERSACRAAAGHMVSASTRQRRHGSGDMAGAQMARVRCLQRHKWMPREAMEHHTTRMPRCDAPTHA